MLMSTTCSKKMALQFDGCRPELTPVCVWVLAGGWLYSGHWRPGHLISAWRSLRRTGLTLLDLEHLAHAQPSSYQKWRAKPSCQLSSPWYHTYSYMPVYICCVSDRFTSTKPYYPLRDWPLNKGPQRLQDMRTTLDGTLYSQSILQTASRHWHVWLPLVHLGTTHCLPITTSMTIMILYVCARSLC